MRRNEPALPFKLDNLPIIMENTIFTRSIYICMYNIPCIDFNNFAYWNISYINITVRKDEKNKNKDKFLAAINEVISATLLPLCD